MSPRGEELIHRIEFCPCVQPAFPTQRVNFPGAIPPFRECLHILV